MPTKKQIDESINHERHKEAIRRIDFLSNLLLTPDLVAQYEEEFKDDIPGDLYLGAWFRTLRLVLEALWRENEEFRDFMKPFVFNNLTQIMNSWYETTKDHNSEVSDESSDVGIEEATILEMGGSDEEEDRQTSLTLVEGPEWPSAG